MCVVGKNMYIYNARQLRQWGYCINSKSITPIAKRYCANSKTLFNIQLSLVSYIINIHYIIKLIHYNIRSIMWDRGYFASGYRYTHLLSTYTTLGLQLPVVATTHYEDHPSSHTLFQTSSYLHQSTYYIIELIPSIIRLIPSNYYS